MAFTQTVARVEPKPRRNVGQAGFNSMLSDNRVPRKLTIRISQSRCVKKNIHVSGTSLVICQIIALLSAHQTLSEIDEVMACL